MPPASAHKIPNPKQKELLTQWVAEGAKYEGHCAYQPLRPGPGSIDSSLDRELAKVNLAKAPEANRATLLRRLSLDLTGLPADLASFEAMAFTTPPRPKHARKLHQRPTDRPT